MKSPITFEEINTHFKCSRVALVVTLYHWASPDTDNYKFPLRMSDLSNDKQLYVCDDALSWADAHLMDGCQLYEIDCVIQNPLCLMEQFMDYECVFRKPSPEYSLFLKGDFDALIYTQHIYSRGVRQCLIKNPVKQVLAIREIEKPSIDDIVQHQDSMGKLWSEILLEKKVASK